MRVESGMYTGNLVFCKTGIPDRNAVNIADDLEIIVNIGNNFGKLPVLKSIYGDFGSNGDSNAESANSFEKDLSSKLPTDGVGNGE